MLDYWDGKQVMVFMIIRNSKFWFFLLIFVACTRDLSDDPIPIVPFADVVINLNLPEYLGLQTVGGYKELSIGGVRGIIIYRVSSSGYIAYERNCSYRPNDACATVNAHSSGLFMVDPCCSSNFSFTDGSPTGGPAWRPLQQYRTRLSGSTLTISDEIIN
jgi:nitrite reductase/ring-hydroxylating ferredoxin subunit